ncbi:MAG: hypothetical protein U0930_22705 [Pirellulales bacterium]
MSEIGKVVCVGCKKSIRYPLSKAGTIAKCPGCGAELKIPRLEASVINSEKKSEVKRGNVERSIPASQSQLIEQPKSADEFHEDKSRLATAVSMSANKYEIVEPYLMKYETPIAAAIQRQFPFSIFSDIVLLTSHRLMVFERFFTKVNHFDVNYVDFSDVTVQQGFFTSTLSIRAIDGRRKVVAKLITSQALQVYRLCQDIETKAKLARRQFELEENRSRVASMNIQNVVPSSDSQSQIGPVIVSHRDVSKVGDEERDPFRLGD